MEEFLSINVALLRYKPNSDFAVVGFAAHYGVSRWHPVGLQNGQTAQIYMINYTTECWCEQHGAQLCHTVGSTKSTWLVLIYCINTAVDMHTTSSIA